MKHPFAFASRKREGGSVAVEAALCMTFILLPLLSVTFILGKYFWYYTAAQKAVHDAALYMAAAPLAEIRNGGAGALAIDIMTKETSDFDGHTTVVPSVLCAYKFANTTMIFWAPCSGTSTPVTVQAAIELNISHPFFSPISDSAGSDDRINLWALSQVAYVGI